MDVGQVKASSKGNIYFYGDDVKREREWNVRTYYSHRLSYFNK